MRPSLPAPIKREFGPVLVPNSRLIGAGKEGRIYIVNTNNMGKYNAVVNPCAISLAHNLDSVAQEMIVHTIGTHFGTPVYWDGPVGQLLYFLGDHDHIKAFRLNNGRLSGPISTSLETFGFACSGLTLSSNGTRPDTGIIWVIDRGGILMAYDATNLHHRLYFSKFGLANKFVPPVVSNGKVFVPSQNSLLIYGLLK